MHERIISTRAVAECLRLAKANTTRLLRFPDGVTRYVTLPGWLWGVFDRGDSPTSKIRPDDFLYLALKAAHKDRRYPDWSMETKLRYFLGIYLETAVHENSAYVRRHANDIG